MRGTEVRIIALYRLEEVSDAIQRLMLWPTYSSESKRTRSPVFSNLTMRAVAHDGLRSAAAPPDWVYLLAALHDQEGRTACGCTPRTTLQ